MINVDVYVPSLDRVYNFNLDEESKLSVLIEELSELICKKEHSLLEGEKERFIMGSIDQRLNFNSEYSLKEYSVKNGERLILA
jgi:hypothetical protein